jgi:hypothetical protein
MTCADDLNPYATSGEDAAVLVLGVRGTLTASNSGGTPIATMIVSNYGTFHGQTEYEVLYKAATSTPASDTLTISDSGSKSSVVLPVKIVSPGDDAGASFFALELSSGYVCPGQQVGFITKTQGDAKVVLSETNANIIAIGQGDSDEFALGILEDGTGVVTATAGASTVIYPANIPATGFTAGC